MAVTTVDLLKALPRTNCKECGYPACLAFALAAIKDGVPLERCRHLLPGAEPLASRLKDQQALGKGSSREALEAAREAMHAKIAPLDFKALAPGLGAVYKEDRGVPYLLVDYFGRQTRIFKDRILYDTETPADPWDDIFLYNYVYSQGNTSLAGEWISFNELSFHLRDTAALNLTGQNSSPWGEEDCEQLRERALRVGAIPTAIATAADMAFIFRPVCMAPVMLLCYKAEPDEGMRTEIRFLFDASVGAYLDYEGAFFLVKRIRELLAEA